MKDVINIKNNRLDLPEGFSFPDTWLLGRFNNEKEYFLIRWSSCLHSLIGFDLQPIVLGDKKYIHFYVTNIDRLADILKRK